MPEQPGEHGLNTGGIEITLRYRDGSNVAKLVGSEQALLKLLALDKPELLDSLIDAAVERKLGRLAREVQEDPDRFWREYMPPYTYQPPLLDESQENGLATTSGTQRGRKKGDTNASPEYFHALYRNAVDGEPIGLPRLQRPYRLTHLATRSGLSYKAFKKYLELWGPPAGYAKPH